MTLRRHLDKIGTLGSIFAALCCLGAPALVAVLSALGLGFLINDAYLAPLLIVSLAVAIAGLALGIRHHHRRLPLVIGSVAGVTLVLFIYVVPSGPAAYASLAALIIATLLYVVFGRPRKPAVVTNTA
jgi:mercuric ion transport protein